MNTQRLNFVTAFLFLMITPFFKPVEAQVMEAPKKMEAKKVNPHRATTQSANRDIPNPSRWIVQKSLFCKTQSLSVTILRPPNYQPGNSAYKLRVEYSATISEFTDLARKNILSRTYGGSPLYNATVITRNARSGEYCNRNQIWIIGTVYSVDFPNSMGGTIYTTTTLHDPDVHLNFTSVTDLINIYNRYRGAQGFVNSCTEYVCGSGSIGDTSGVGADRLSGSRANMAKINKMKKTDIRYLDHTKGDKGGGIIKPDKNAPKAIDTRKLNTKQ